MISAIREAGVARKPRIEIEGGLNSVTAGVSGDPGFAAELDRLDRRLVDKSMQMKESDRFGGTS